MIRKWIERIILDVIILRDEAYKDEREQTLAAKIRREVAQQISNRVHDIADPWLIVPDSPKEDA